LRKAATKSNIPLCRYRLAAGPHGARWWIKMAMGEAPPTTPQQEQPRRKRTAWRRRRRSKRPSRRRKAPQPGLHQQRERSRPQLWTRSLRKTSPTPHPRVA
jgi:hypothetical protein